MKLILQILLVLSFVSCSHNHIKFVKTDYKANEIEKREDQPNKELASSNNETKVRPVSNHPNTRIKSDEKVVIVDNLTNNPTQNKEGKEILKYETVEKHSDSIEPDYYMLSEKAHSLFNISSILLFPLLSMFIIPFLIGLVLFINARVKYLKVKNTKDEIDSRTKEMMKSAEKAFKVAKIMLIITLSLFFVFAVLAVASIGGGLSF